MTRSARETATPWRSESMCGAADGGGDRVEHNVLHGAEPEHERRVREPGGAFHPGDTGVEQRRGVGGRRLAERMAERDQSPTKQCQEVLTPHETISAGRSVTRGVYVTTSGRTGRFVRAGARLAIRPFPPLPLEITVVSHATGYATDSAKSKLGPFQFERREPGPKTYASRSCSRASVIPTSIRRATSGAGRSTRWCRGTRSWGA